MNRIGVFIVCILLAGCGGEKGAPTELQEKDAQLRRMQERLVEVQQAQSSEINSLQRQLTEARRDLGDESEQQTKLVQLLRNQVETLREENRKLLLENSRLAKNTAPPEPPKPPATPAFKRLNAAVTRAAEVKTSFPVRVTDLQGRKVVTGTHTVKEFVPSEETYKDKFGRVRQEGKWEDKTVNQYGYEIVFSMVNETDDKLQLTARAGMASESMTLGPRETRINSRLVAARGSGLWLLSGGKSLKVDVKYEGE